MKVNVNADKLFAAINTIDELKETANYVVTEIKNAYMARVAELLAQMDGGNELLTVAATDDTKAAKATTVATTKAAKGETAAKAKAAKARKDTTTAKDTTKADAQTTTTATIKAAKTEVKADAKAVKATTKAKATTVKATKAADTESEKTAKVEQVKIASLTKKQITAMNIHFEQYSEKCMFMTGETKCIKDEIKAIGGAHWNGARKGWFIKNDNAKTLAKALKIKLA